MFLFVRLFMRVLLAFVLCGCWTLSAATPNIQQATTVATDRSKIQLRQLTSKDTAALTKVRGPVSAAALPTLLKLDKRHRFQLLTERRAPESGQISQVFQQSIDGYEIYGHRLTVTTSKQGSVSAVEGWVAEHNAKPLPKPVLTEKQALSKAKALMGEAAQTNNTEVLVADTSSTSRVIYFDEQQRGVTAYLVNYFIDKGHDNAIHPYFVIADNNGEVLANWQKTPANKASMPAGAELELNAALTVATGQTGNTPAMPALNLPPNLQGQAAVAALGDDLAAVAAFYDKSPEQLRAMLLNDSTVRLDNSGHIYFVEPVRGIDSGRGMVPDEITDSSGKPLSLNSDEQLPQSSASTVPAHVRDSHDANDHEVHPHEAHNEQRHQLVEGDAAVDAPIEMQAPQIPMPQLANAFAANSKLGAKKTIYLDFTGHTVVNTQWNNLRGVSSFVQQPFDLDGNPSTFSDTERDFILKVWQQVANDFASFDVNVTTQEPTQDQLTRSSSTDLYYGVRVVISPSNMAAICGLCGGVAYLNVFDYFGPNDYSPAFVFTDSYSTVAEVAGTASHEVGHTLGLSHDGNSSETYYPGHGFWTTLMGGGSQPIQHWSKGEYTDANNTEDDLDIIDRKLGYRVDDHAGVIASATAVGAVWPLSVPQKVYALTARGIIERSGDKDFFSLTAENGAVLRVRVTPSSTTLHAKAYLYNASGALVASGESADSDNGTGEIILGDYVNTGSSGQQTYYVAVEGAGSGNVATTGYSNYGSLGHYVVYATMANTQTITATPPVRATVGQSGTFSAYVDSNRPLTFTSTTTSVCSVTSSSSAAVTLNYLAPGNCSIRVRQAGLANLPAVEQTFSFAVKHQQVLSPTSLPDRLVSAGSFNQTISSSSGLPLSLGTWNSSINAGACSVSRASNSSLSINVIGQGTCQFRLYQDGNTNYWPAEPVTVVFYLRNYQQVITFGANPGPRVYGTGNFNVSATTPSSASVVFSSKTPAICTVSGSSVTPVAAGNCVIAANAAMDANYLKAAEVSQTIVISKAQPSFNVVAVGSKTYGDAPFNLSVSASSGGVLNYSSNTPQVCSVQSGSVTLLAAGYCAIVVNVAATTNYTAATTVVSFNILRAAQTISLGSNPSSVTYGDAAFMLQGSVPSTAAVRFTSKTPAVCTVSNNQLSIVAAGTCNLQADADADSNYLAAAAVSFSIAINKATQIIAFHNLPSAKTFGDAPFAIAAQTPATSAVTITSVTPSVCSVTNNTISILQAGNCTLAASAAADANYLAAATVYDWFPVYKAEQLIQFEPLPAQLAWGETVLLQARVPSSSAVVFESTTPSICSVGSDGLLQLHGIGACTIAAAAAADSNYLAASSVLQTVMIIKAAQHINFEPLTSQTFGAGNIVLSASGGGSDMPVVFSSTSPAICSVSESGVLTMLAVGNCQLHANQAGNDFFEAAAQISQTLQINKAVPTAEFIAIEPKVYGAAPFELAINTNSAGEISYNTSTPQTCAVEGATVTITAAGTCDILAQISESGNYLAAQIRHTFVIDKAHQTVVFESYPTQLRYGDDPIMLQASTPSSSVITLTSKTPTVCAVTANRVVIILGAGSCDLTAQAAADVNYYAAALVNLTISIAKATQEIEFIELPSTRRYGDAPFEVVAVTQSSVSVKISSNTPEICSVSVNRVTPLRAGSCVITANAAADANYLAASPVQRTIVIEKIAQRIDVEQMPQTLAWGEQLAISATTQSSSALEFNSATPAVCQLSATGVIEPVAIGRCVVAIEAAEDVNYYEAATKQLSVDIVKAAQVIVLDPELSKTESSNEFRLSFAGGESQQPVVVTSATPEVCTVNINSIISITGDGVCVLHFNQASNEFYLAAEEVIHRISVQLDSDGDGISDIDDNCPQTANPDQRDYNGNGIGDVCNDFMPMPTDDVGNSKADKLGAQVAYVGDFDGDGYGDIAVAAPGFDKPNPANNNKLIKDVGRVQVISGRSNEVLRTINGDKSKDQFGMALVGSVDFNNDGYSDLVIGAPLADSGGFKDNGAVIIVYGGPTENNVRLNGPRPKAYFGASLAAAADSLAIGAPRDTARDWPIKMSGTVYLYGVDDSPYGPVMTYPGSQSKAMFGSSVALADVTQDGLVELIVGAAKMDNDTGGKKIIDAGSVSAYTIGNTELPLMTFYGSVPKARLGSTVAVGDVNADGINDIVAGAPGDDHGLLKDTGSVTVFYGNTARADLSIYGPAKKTNLGNALAVADVDGDGYDDIVIGASKADKTKLVDIGSVSVISGKTGEALRRALYGERAKDNFGASVSAGDINNDGYADIIIGVPGFDDPLNKKAKDIGRYMLLDGMH